MKRIYEKLVKRALLSTFIGLLSMASFASTYYISITGNDSNSGLTSSLPWKSLAKVNAVNFKAGDQILFQKGNTFYGSLAISSSGAAGSPIIFGAYGTGANPIITGFTTVNAWNNLGGNIWESTTAVSSLSTCNMVAVNGVNTAMGRYPNANAANSGYLIFQSHSGSTSISSSGLTGTTNWTGAEIVMRENHYLLERSAITSQSGGTLGFSPATVYAPLDGFGFFIQNDARTLDVQNEWYYNPSTKKIRIYSGSQPTDVKVASVTSLLTASGNYITANGVDFTGSNGDNIAGRGTHTTIQNCNVSFSGMNHISTSGAYYIVIDNTFTDTNNNGISIQGSHSVISRNTLTNNGVFQGMGRTAGLGINSALSVGGAGTIGYTIEGNKVINSGFNGIVFYADSVTVKNNFVDTFCRVLDDGGGIYTYTGGRKQMNAIKIYGNIVINGIGDTNGISGSFPTIAAGIYCDNETANVEMYNNSIANCHEYGIFQNINHNINIHNNTVYNTSMAQFRASWSSNIIINNNIFVSKDATQNSLYISSGSVSTIPSWVIANNNYYARPIDDNKVIFVEQPGIGGAASFKTIAEWKSFSRQDANSNKSPQKITSVNDLQFEYNATKSAKTVSLSRPMIDVKGTKYSGTLTLQPYTSVILIKDNSTSSVLPILYNVTGGGSYLGGGSGVAIGLSNSQPGVNYQLKLSGVNNGTALTGTGNVLSFGNKTVAGVYTVTAIIVSTGSTVNMTGNATVTVTVNQAPVVVSGESISPTSAGISVGATQQLNTSISPSNATNTTVSWSSGNTSVATVNSLGLVTGIAAGSATITATTQDGAKIATSAITVSGGNGATLGLNSVGGIAESGDNGFWIASSFTPVSNMTVNRINLYVSQASGKARLGIYSSSSAEPGTLIAQSGEISLSNGWNSGSIGSSQNLIAGVTYWLAFEVNSSATTLQYNTASGRSRYKSYAYGPLPSAAPLNCTSGIGIYSIYADNSSVVRSTLVTGVSVNPASAGISVGATQQLTAVVSPSNATNKIVSWSSGNTSVVTVNSMGLITGLAAGSAVITATTQDGGKTATSAITVSSNGATMGLNTIGSKAESGDNGFWIASSFTPVSNMTVNRINLYVSQASGKARLGIYSSSSSEPGTLIAQSGEISLSKGWNSGSIGSSQNLIAGVTYWLAFEVNSSATTLQYNTASGRSRYKSYAYGSLPTSAPLKCISGTGIYSIYVDGGLKGANIGTPDIEDLSGMVKMDVFPNPSEGKITVRFSSLVDADSRIDILDISGRKVTSRIITGIAEEFNLENQPAGLYFVKSILGSKNITKKLLIKK